MCCVTHDSPACADGDVCERFIGREECSGQDLEFISEITRAYERYCKAGRTYDRCIEIAEQVRKQIEEGESDEQD
jgi:hypothetical protein